MKFKIKFDHMPEYVFIRTEGNASAQGFDNLLTTLVDSPEWKTGSRQLVDHRNLVIDSLSAEDIQKIEEVVRKHTKNLGNGRCAFVVKDLLGFGLVRMYELVGGEDIHLGVRVFYSIDEAAEWLKQKTEFIKDPKKFLGL